eukprot:scaffold22233_cov55-Phaeocystis_antarctica.AAC.3
MSFLHVGDLARIAHAASWSVGSGTRRPGACCRGIQQRSSCDSVNRQNMTDMPKAQVEPAEVQPLPKHCP